MKKKSEERKILLWVNVVNVGEPHPDERFPKRESEKRVIYTCRIRDILLLLNDESLSWFFNL